ncbi:MAG: prepilin-type N-terminal cleavage/methylation domain-containing protein [Rubritalea sp.]|uniref:type IV pilus modification PilV family protein n=1 Tax=Rubritalea sp. TaxID=2109375 RepID=UPI003242EE27
MRKNISSRKGFSLVEVVIAIGLVAVLLTTFMAVFGPAQKNISNTIRVAEANRLVHTLENEMAILRPGEDDYTTAFDKAFQWIKDSHDEDNAIIIYQYHALPNSENPDGTLQVAVDGNKKSLITDDQKLPGVDYITQTVARRLDKADAAVLSAELSPGIVQGAVYAVRMTQLYNKGGSSGLELLTNGNELKPGIVNPSDDGNVLADSSLYEEAYVTLQVEFFPLNNNLHAYVTNGPWEFDKLGSPVATQNIAVRR